MRNVCMIPTSRSANIDLFPDATSGPMLAGVGPKLAKVRQLRPDVDTTCGGLPEYTTSRSKMFWPNIESINHFKPPWSQPQGLYEHCKTQTPNKPACDVGFNPWIWTNIGAASMALSSRCHPRTQALDMCYISAPLLLRTFETLKCRTRARHFRMRPK